MKLRLSTLCSSKGFTLLELLVTSALGLILLSLIVGITMSLRSLYSLDLVRTDLNQNLRGSLDLLGINIREAGENFSPSFPAVELQDGSPDTADILTLRRNLVDEVLKLCVAISAGTATTTVYFAASGTDPGCAYSAQLHNYNSWRTYRLAQGGAVKAFIYNSTTKEGEFFDYTSESDTGTAFYIQRSGGSWAHDYDIDSTSLYLLEQWEFLLDTSTPGEGLFQVVQNEDLDSPLNIAFGIRDFQVQITLQDSTVKETFTRDDTWTDIKLVTVSLSGRTILQGKNIDRTLSGQFFPRNILSH